MATKTGINIYIDGVKHNSTPQAATQTAYDISDVKAPGESFDIQFSNVYDDGGESALTAAQTHTLLAESIPIYTPESETTAYMNEIGITNDSTLYFDNTLEAKTGNQIWKAHNDWELEVAAFRSKIKLFFPIIGGDETKSSVNAINPTNTTQRLNYSGFWKFTTFGHMPTKGTESITLPFKYNDASLGLSENNITIGAYNPSNSRARKHIFGNVVGGGERAQFVIERSNLRVGLTNNMLDYPFAENSSKGSFLATITSDNIGRTYKDGVKLGENVGENGKLPASENITLHEVTATGGGESSQPASFYYIGEGLTDSEAITMTGAVKNYAEALNRNNDRIPAPVIYASDLSKNSIYYGQVHKSSDWPELTTTKPYFVIYSTDHNSPGGVTWGEMDDLEYNGFIERGVIFTGYSNETPWLIRVPTSESGLTSDEVFLYFHTDGSDPDNAPIAQQTHLFTTSGGAELHNCNWTDRGKPIVLESNYSHTGYARFWKRGVGDYVSNHLGQANISPSKVYISTSTDGITFNQTKEVFNDTNMPAGSIYRRNQIGVFSYNGTTYGFIIEYDGVDSYVAVTTLDADYLPLNYLGRISSPLAIRTLTHAIDGDQAYIYVKTGESNNEYLTGSIFMIKYDLTQLL